MLAPNLLQFEFSPLRGLMLSYANEDSMEHSQLEASATPGVTPTSRNGTSDEGDVRYVTEGQLNEHITQSKCVLKKTTPSIDNLKRISKR